MASGRGSILQDNGKFGFIKQDSSEVDMFVMTPREGPFAGALPPLGTRVMYDIVLDAKTGKPRAENLRPEASRVPGIRQREPAGAFGALPRLAAAIQHDLGAGPCAGTMLKNSGSFGFIKQDSGEEDMFVMPPSCQAFGCAFPPVGCRVTYDIVLDTKTGRPRAENVQPEAAGSSMPSEAASRSSPQSTPRREPANDQDTAEEASDVLGGMMLKDNGNFGFIAQDSGEEDMFVIPPSCVGFGGLLPPIGTRVLYQVVTDGKTGRPRAENVKPEGGLEHAQPTADHQSSGGTTDQAVAMADESFEIRIGTMLKDNGNFGFIKQDNGEEDMFVMPPSCAAFGGHLPPVGTRLVYDVVTDSKTGRPRAENVRPEDTAMSELVQQLDGQAALRPGTLTGTFVEHKGNFGFIRQDSGQEDMFVMPPSCEGFGSNLPPIGSRVVYEVVEDSKTGRPRAEKVYPENAGAPVAWAQPRQQSWTPPVQRAPAPAVASPAGLLAGTLTKNNGNFGFIQQDSGEEDMFVMPPSCPGFGGHLPPIGARVTYGVVLDARTGRPRAENVQPEPSSPLIGPRAGVGPQRAMLALPVQAPVGPAVFVHAPKPVQHGPASLCAGTMLQITGNFGFIKQDSGEPDMFVLPPSCHSFGGNLPPVGTRVVYEIVVDGKTGRPRAESVQPEPMQAAYANQPQGGLQAGTIVKDNGKFGFIKQDSGEEDMFMLASANEPLPPIGTRVLYDVVIDGKTGRPRAENVLLESNMHAQGPYVLAGTMIQHRGSFGFIKQDSGEADMFMMPPTTGPFAGALPPLGARVVYDVVIDGKTGRPRAENVLPEPAHPAGGKGHGYGPAVSKGKGASRSLPYGY